MADVVSLETFEPEALESEQASWASMSESSTAASKETDLLMCSALSRFVRNSNLAA